MESPVNIEMFLREHDLTVEEVLSLPLFANFTIAEAEELILTVKKFSIIVFNAHQKMEEDVGKNG